VSYPLVGDLAAEGISVRLTELRAPARPLVLLPHRLGEVTGPVFGAERLRPGEADLTRSEGRPEVLGQRIVVGGRVLDSDGRPVADSLVEVWQANAAGR